MIPSDIHGNTKKKLQQISHWTSYSVSLSLYLFFLNSANHFRFIFFFFIFFFFLVRFVFVGVCMRPCVFCVCVCVRKKRCVLCTLPPSLLMRHACASVKNDLFFKTFCQRINAPTIFELKTARVYLLYIFPFVPALHSSRKQSLVLCKMVRNCGQFSN